MIVEDIFYSYPCHEIPTLNIANKLSNKLCVKPSQEITSEFKSTMSKKLYQEEFNETQLPPIENIMLRREAQEKLQKIKPSLSKNNLKLGSEKPQQDNYWKILRGNISRSVTFGDITLLNSAINQIFQTDCQCVGNFFYPKGGYRSWHTNKYDANGWVIFFVQVTEQKRSFFRFIHPDTKEMITCWDMPGTVNFFHINPNSLFWHCICSKNTDRWSQGFLVPENWQQLLFHPQ